MLKVWDFNLNLRIFLGDTTWWVICAYSCIFRISHLEMFQIHHFRRRAQGGLDGSDWFVILISISAGWFIESRCGYKLQYFFVYSYSPDSSFMNWEIVNTNSYVLWSSYSWLAEKYILPILRLSFQIFPWFMDNRGETVQEDEKRGNSLKYLNWTWFAYFDLENDAGTRECVLHRSCSRISFQNSIHKHCNESSYLMDRGSKTWPKFPKNAGAGHCMIPLWWCALCPVPLPPCVTGAGPAQTGLSCEAPAEGNTRDTVTWGETRVYTCHLAPVREPECEMSTYQWKWPEQNMGIKWHSDPRPPDTLVTR